jgi:hypothetical protein
MKYAIEMGSGAMIYIYIPGFMKIDSGIQKLMTQKDGGRSHNRTLLSRLKKIAVVFWLFSCLLMLQPSSCFENWKFSHASFPRYIRRDPNFDPPVVRRISDAAGPLTQLRAPISAKQHNTSLWSRIFASVPGARRTLYRDILQTRLPEQLEVKLSPCLTI